MNNKRVGLIILLLLLAVGFASVTTNLIINNNVNISAKTDDFSVVFTSANTEEDSSAIISDDNKTITYVTKELLNIGDKSELEYTIKNNSSQYDADINLSVGLDNSISDLISITYETIDPSNTISLLAKDEVAGKIKIELIKPAIDNMEVTLTLTFNANATERTSIAYDTYNVRFNANGGTGEMDSQAITYGITTSLSSNQFTRSGYQMVGWTTNPETNEVLYLDTSEVTNLVRSGSTVDLYAVWMKTDYDYTGGIQNFTAPVSGTYKLETWGAQGGGMQPGYGGYSAGNVSLTKNNILTVVVGGAGVVSTNGNNGGGYNGGGHGTNVNQPGSGGGGATHIATTNRGVLSNYNSYRSELLIVSGGGGGSLIGTSEAAGWGGSGGGYVGVNGGYQHKLNWSFYGTGGSQTSGGICYLYGTDRADSGSFGKFGQGGNHGYESGTNTGGSGGGGGFFGGGGASRSHAQAGGGSGYIGNTLLTNKQMVCYSCATSNDINTKTISNTCTSSSPTVNCSKQGNGYARITFIG